MTLSNFRATAREKLTGKWGKAACITLAYMFITFIISAIQSRLANSVNFIISIAVAVISVPISFGVLISFINLYNGKEANAFDFFSLGFSNFSRAWKVAFNMLVRLIVPIIVFILSMFFMVGAFVYSVASPLTNNLAIILVAVIVYIASIIWFITKSYYYTLSDIIAIENPEISPKSAVEKSKELMTGNRAKFFLLQLSFIGWAILAMFTFGIGMLWLTPYIVFAQIAFYQHLVNNDNNPIEN